MGFTKFSKYLWALSLFFFVQMGDNLLALDNSTNTLSLNVSATEVAGVNIYRENDFLELEQHGYISEKKMKQFEGNVNVYKAFGCIKFFYKNNILSNMQIKNKDQCNYMSLTLGDRVFSMQSNKEEVLSYVQDEYNYFDKKTNVRIDFVNDFGVESRMHMKFYDDGIKDLKLQLRSQ